MNNEDNDAVHQHESNQKLAQQEGILSYCKIRLLLHKKLSYVRYTLPVLQLLPVAVVLGRQFMGMQVLH